jgi:hypothetical protein
VDLVQYERAHDADVAPLLKLIGKPLRRFNSPAKVDGTVQFGIDVRVLGMMGDCPEIGGDDNESVTIGRLLTISPTWATEHARDG